MQNLFNLNHKSSEIFEIWKPIINFEGRYFISNNGNIKSIKQLKNKTLIERIKKPLLDKHTGYLKTQLLKNGKYYNFFIHRLIAEYFILNPNAYEIVHHKDGNKINNYISNLEWTTRKNNRIYSIINKKSSKHAISKLKLYPPLKEIEKIVNSPFVEIWKNIINYEGLYQVSNYGRIKSLNRTDSNNHKIFEKILKPIFSGTANTINLYKNGYKQRVSIHRIVANHFIPNLFNYPIINHLNGNKKDNRFTNLEWCTYSINHKHAYEIGLKQPKRGEESHLAKLTQKDVEKIRFLYKTTDLTQSNLAQIFNVQLKCIYSILNEFTWKTENQLEPRKTHEMSPQIHTT